MNGPTYSPDGKWMWNGSEWIPAPPQPVIQQPVMKLPGAPLPPRPMIQQSMASQPMFQKTASTVYRSQFIPQPQKSNKIIFISAVFVLLLIASTVIYAWTDNLDDEQSEQSDGRLPNDGDFTMISFSLRDAASDLTSNSSESIVYVAMDSGDDFVWAALVIQISVDNGPFSECTNPDRATETGCALSDDGDQKWAFGEEITISEGSDDICSASCDIQVKILDRATNKLIFESSVFEAK